MARSRQTRSARPIGRWRLKNLLKVLRYLDPSIKQAITLLAEAISAEKKGEDVAAVKDRLQRKVRGDTFSDLFAEKVEYGCRRLVRDGKLPAPYAEPGILDHRIADPNVVYVHATVNIPAWRQICAELEAIPEVLEASLVYGSADVDAIIKIAASAERINEILMRDIQPLRHILRTQTLQSVSYSRWQREQPAWSLDPEMFERDEAEKVRDIGVSEFDVREIERSILSIEEHPYPEELKRLFLREMNSKISAFKEMRNGRLTLRRSDSLEMFPAKLVATATRRIDAVVVVSEIADGECRRILHYLDAQQARIEQTRGLFEVRRIFVVDDEDVLRSDEAIQGRLGAEIHRGVQVRYLVAKDWPKARRDACPVDIGILDDAVCWVLSEPNDEQIRVVNISLQENDILRRQQDYAYLWDRAHPLDKALERVCTAARTGFEYRCGSNEI